MTTAAQTVRADAQSAMERARSHLLSLQRSDGEWWAELESNATMTAEHMFLLSIFDRADNDTVAGVRNELVATRREDGSWPIWFGGPPDLSVAVEAYTALRLCGVPADDPEMRRTCDLIRSMGGVNKARFFTRLWLAVMGLYPWRALPYLPPEMIFLPPRAPLSIYRFACWARQTFVALMVVLSQHPTYPQAVTIDELYLEAPGSVPGPPPRTPGPWTTVFRAALPLARVWGRRGPRRMAEAAYRRIARWILERQEADGSWGGIQPPWVYSLIALHTLGYPLDHPALARGFAGLDGFVIRDGERLRMQGCVSPVWDTCLATVALADTGLRDDHPDMARAIAWMRGKEVTRYGDWHAIPRRGRPGGWSFEIANEWYPDTDDTAEVILSFVKAGVPVSDGAIRRGVDWLLAMQSSGGGWGSFDVDNDHRIMTQLPVCDFGEVIDWPTEDVTAHILEALVAAGLPPEHPAIRRGVDYLLAEQRPDGSWWGRWGVNHVYGTGAVLPALAAVGEDLTAPHIRRAVDWLARHQNADGGWGERIDSYRDPAWIGRGDSTASQTAWALMGLLAADPAHEAIDGGVRWLVENQSPNGEWHEDAFTGTGFPGDFMIKYHYYRLYFPLSALGRYLA